MKTKNILLIIAVLLVAWIGVGSQIPTVLPTSPVTEFVEFLKGVRITGPLEVGPVGRSLKVWWNFEDFISAPYNSADRIGVWSGVVSGTAARVRDAIGTALRPGRATISAGTTTTGYAALHIGPNLQSPFLFGGGVYTIEADVNFAALSDVTDTYALRFGFGDNMSAAPVDGAYFEYSDAGATPNWYAVTANNSTRTTTDTTVAAAITWTRLKIVVNSTGTAVTYYINDTLVATNTTNIPTGAGRNTSALFGVIKSAGTTDIEFGADWIWLHVDLNVSR